MDLFDQTMANFLQLVSSLQQAVIMTPVGPGSFAAVSQAQLSMIQQTANTIKTNLETLKG